VHFADARLATGPRLHYAEHGAPDGEAILFLHGWPDSWFSFSRMLPLLPASYRALVPDQRGFGDSDRPDSGYRIADLADDAAAFCDALSVERVTVVGHSLGSFIARRLAIAHPARVARLVLIGSASTAVSPVTREVQQAIRDLPNPVPLDFAREFQASTAYVPLPETFFQTMLAESCKLPARLWRDVLDGVLSYDDAGQLARISAPTLLIWGDRDALFSMDEQDRLLAGLPHATLKVYPETGHCPNWERPEQVAADLTAFMRST
jgi:pimeloyl-ACP methyl ester carboxylesterase